MPTHSNISLTVMQQDRGLLGVTCSLFNQTHSRATLALMLLTAESSSNKSVKTVIIKNYNIFRFIREAQKKAQSPATVTGNKNKNKNTTISSPSSIIIYIITTSLCSWSPTIQWFCSRFLPVKRSSRRGNVWSL